MVYREIYLEIKKEFNVLDPDEAPISSYFRTYMKYLLEAFPMLHGSTFKLLQVSKDDKIYFDGSNKGMWFKWLNENGLLLTKPNKIANHQNALTFPDVDKVVELMGYKVSVEGNGWNNPKYHAFLHLTRPIAYIGVPEIYNGARSESNLIFNIKKPAHRTNATLTFQTMLRYGEQRTICVAYSLLNRSITESIDGSNNGYGIVEDVTPDTFFL